MYKVFKNLHLIGLLALKYLKYVSLVCNFWFFFAMHLPSPLIAFILSLSKIFSYLSYNNYLPVIFNYQASDIGFVTLILLAIHQILFILFFGFYYIYFFRKSVNFPFSILFLILAFLYIFNLRSPFQDLLVFCQDFFFMPCASYQENKKEIQIATSLLIFMWHFSNIATIFYNMRLKSEQDLPSFRWPHLSEAKSILQLNILYNQELSNNLSYATRLSLSRDYKIQRARLSLKWRLLRYLL